jgi:hypothetical protein
MCNTVKNTPTIAIDEETKKELDWYLIELANNIREIPTFSRAVHELLKKHKEMLFFAVNEETQVRIIKIGEQISIRRGRQTTFEATVSELCDLWEQKEADVKP